jgi:hypothetical protein
MLRRKPRHMLPQQRYFVVLAVIRCFFSLAMSEPTADCVQLLSSCMLQCAAFPRDIYSPPLSPNVFAALVHDNLPLHPLPNHLADPADAQLLIGGSAGESGLLLREGFVRGGRGRGGL